jgi:galactose mutarotase-like enzyme
MISITSDFLEVAVVPEIGAQIVSLKDKQGHEYLAPAVSPRPPDLPLSASFNDGGLGGIDDCLPAIAAGTYPVEPFADWPIPDHGELWLRPWQVQSQTEAEIKVSITGLRLPYSLTRHTAVVDDALRLAYTLTNEGDIDLPVVWASHPMLQPTPGLEIDLGMPDTLLVEASNAGLAAGSTIPYPVIEIGDRSIDLRSWGSLPEGFYLKAFAAPPAGAAATLTYPEWGTSLEIVTESRHPLHLGLWLNRGGFPEDEPVEHLSLEPTFGSSDSLEKALKDDSSLILKARETEMWTLTYRVVIRKESA